MCLCKNCNDDVTVKRPTRSITYEMKHVQMKLKFVITKPVHPFYYDCKTQVPHSLQKMF